MQTKIVYAVVTDGLDSYLEQLLLSVVSLRHYNTDVHVTLITDKESRTSFTGDRNSILSYIDELVVVDAPNDYSKVMRSRFLKTTLRQHIKGNFLFLDSDTLIAGSLNDIDLVANSGMQIGAVNEFHLSFEEYMQSHARGVKKHGFVLDVMKDKAYYNSGVMYVADTQETHIFFEHWNRNWNANWQKNGVYVDQVPLAITNREFAGLMEPLDNVWNCMIVAYGLPYLSTAKIIHYYADDRDNGVRPYIFTNKSVFLKIKQTFTIPLDLIHYVLNPREAFYPKCKIIIGDDVELINSPIRSMMKDHHKSYFCLKFFARLYLAILNRTIGINKRKRYSHKLIKMNRERK